MIKVINEPNPKIAGYYEFASKRVSIQDSIFKTKIIEVQVISTSNYPNPSIIFDPSNTMDKFRLYKEVIDIFLFKVHDLNVNNYRYKTQGFVPSILSTYANLTLKEGRKFIKEKLLKDYPLKEILDDLNYEYAREEFIELLEDCTNEELEEGWKYSFTDVDEGIKLLYFNELMKRSLIINKILSWGIDLGIYNLLKKNVNNIKKKDISTICTYLMDCEFDNDHKLLNILINKGKFEDEIDLFIKSKKPFCKLIKKDLFDYEEDYNYVVNACSPYAKNNELQANSIASCLIMFPKYNFNFEVLTMQLYYAGLFKYISVTRIPKAKQETIYRRITKVFNKRKVSMVFLRKILNKNNTVYEFNKGLANYIKDHYKEYPNIEKSYKRAILNASL